MSWMIPGTTYECERDEVEYGLDFLQHFLSWNDKQMCDIKFITGLETYTVQNWVKRGFLEPPKQRRYTADQVCRVILINIFKNVFPMEQICGMLSYVNGKLDDSSDDIIPDSQLYFIFVRLAAKAKEVEKDPDLVINRELKDYQDPGAAERIRKVLKIMLIGYLACRMRTEAEKAMNKLMEGEATK